MNVRVAITVCLFCRVAQSQTFTKDIAPILFEHCAPCHRPGEAAPFSLLEYTDAKRHARQIAAVTKSRFMPPWKPEAGKGDFAGERRLSDAQIRMIQGWAANGAPEGDGDELPARPKFVDGWQLGKPDLIVTLDRPYTLAASGPDVFRNFVFRAPVNRNHYIRAIEIRPGNKKVVHHANLLVDRERTFRSRDGQDGAPGFEGMDVRIETHTFDPESHFLFWKPGTSVSEEPEDMAWQLDGTTDLVLNTHLQPSGKPEQIQPSIGLYFTVRVPSKFPMLVQLEHDGAIDIPSGRKEFVVTDKLVLPVDVDVLGIYPHAHYIGKDLQGFGTLPDGSRRWLIHIPDWDINWQAVYRYKASVFLPRGTVITMRYTYDNSSANPRNPSRPPIRVVTGDRSIDEMAHLWLQVLPRAQANQDARLLLQEAVLRRRLAKYPADFSAHFGLGALAQTGGQLADAVTHYRAALRISPADASAHNALGTALLAMGDVEAAASAFETAISHQPDYADAQYNLARLLLASDQPTQAITHLRAAIRNSPNDAVALSDLGAALQMTGHTEEGLGYLREAVRIRPDYFAGRYNLGQALAAAGDIADAEHEFRQALRIKPDDPDAVNALRRVSRK